MRRTTHLTFRLLGRATARVQQPSTLAVVGGASLALALGVAFLPWLFPAGLFRPISAVVGSPLTIVLFGVAAGLLGAQTLRRTATDAAVAGNDARRGDAMRRVDATRQASSANRRDARRARSSGGRPNTERWVPARAPERAHYDEHRITGDQIDSVFESDPDEARDLDASKRKARKRIRGTAISVLAADESVSTETAAERIVAGSWTDDPRAAAFLGGRHLAPLRTRIRDWASGEQFERWATHAVAEVEARERGERDRPESEQVRPESEEGRR